MKVKSRKKQKRSLEQLRKIKDKKKKKKKNYLAEHIHENITTWEDQVNANFIGK